MSLEPNSTIGEYRVLDRVGGGGMGEVYRALHTRIGRVVAIKVLYAGRFDPGLLERFVNEARIQAGLSHPNIAMLYDLLTVDGQPCILMEFVDGPTLRERLASAGPMAPAEAVRIVRAVAEALVYIHGQGIIHRDIKSSNIKLTVAGQVKLLDFGIAKSLASEGLTQPGNVIGTLEYLAPEQIRGGKADARTDIWSVGVLLYELVTGRLPFGGQGMGELYEAIMRGVYAPPPPGLEAVIGQCLRKKASERYESAGALIEGLDAAAASRPALGPVAGFSFRLHWPSRGWIVAATIAAGILATAFVYRTFSDDSSADIRVTRIDSSTGEWKVYQDGHYVGTTPAEVKGQIGQTIRLVMKRNGCEEQSMEFVVSETKLDYTQQIPCH